MHYEQLTQDQRYHISGLLKAGNAQNNIAKEVGVDKSTISRELRRNRGERGYRPKQAEELAVDRRVSAAKHISFTAEVKKSVIDKIKLDWSPEQISGYLKKEKLFEISHERIYQFLLEDKKTGGDLHKHLRHSGKKRKKRYGSRDRRGQIKNRISIDERPAVVDKKSRLGDFEGDTIIGKQQQKAIVTLADSLSKKALIGRVASKHSDVVSDIIIDLLSPVKKITRTITFDNGKEFSDHATIAKALKTNIYFAHPYSSWERGLNENTNRFIRQYIKKGCSFDDITQERITWIQDRLNNRPRKSLGYYTPNEVFDRAVSRMRH